MKDRLFLDTNVLIYCYTVSEPEKQAKAQAVADLSNTVISTQVLKEFSNILRKKFGLDWTDVHAAVEEAESNFELHVNTADSIKKACVIAERYGFSFYDSLIAAAALEAGCPVLYSEDLQDGQRIENVLTVKNPFN